MAGKNFEVGDLVWAQMRSYPPWPSKIAVPPASDKVKVSKRQHWVYFLGSKNYAWIPDDKIFPHSEELVQKTFKYKSAIFHEAVQEIVSESKALEAKKSLMKKALIEERRRILFPKFVFIRTAKKNDSDSSPPHSSGNIIEFDFSDSLNECNENACPK